MVNEVDKWVFNKMNVLSLFDGMACGMIAAKKLGLQINSYHAYEIDKYAIQTATHNFPEIIEHGDVFKADFRQYKSIDFIWGGSPCTYWSIAQKEHRETTASGLGWELFSQYVRALKEVKPKYFIYENNKSMSNAIRDSIREAFGFEEICINSALVSAQNRNRYYWVGKYNPETDWYDKVNICQPEDKGIVLKDVLEDDFYGLWSDYNNNIHYEKSWCLGTGILINRSITNQQVITKNVSIKKFKKGGQKENNYLINGKVDSVRKYVRNLTIDECKKLQTIPEWFEFPVSNSQAAKQIGNGWTVDVIVHLIKSCLVNEKLN